MGHNLSNSSTNMHRLRNTEEVEEDDDDEP